MGNINRLQTIVHNRHSIAVSVCEGFPFQISADHLWIGQDWIVESSKQPYKLENRMHLHLGALMTPIYDEEPTIITFKDTSSKKFNNLNQFFLSEFSEKLKGSYVVGKFNRIKGNHDDFSLALFHQDIEQSLAVTIACMTALDIKRAYVYQRQKRSGLLLLEVE